MDQGANPLVILAVLKEHPPPADQAEQLPVFLHLARLDGAPDLDPFGESVIAEDEAGRLLVGSCPRCHSAGQLNGDELSVLTEARRLRVHLADARIEQMGA
ncbi:hypothetical protein [Streptomyces natalensis]|uniref:hypothetical protein n=1 Tax=Streptomyces natalensis TaxID=68242 RepID=UPI00068CC6A6|nr:hypothetical protein [Streptomyces natalensis]